MRKSKLDPDIRAEARWSMAIESGGHVKNGDWILSLFVVDGEHEEPAERWLIQAFGYWEELFTQQKLVAVENRLPDKVIKASEP
jgi:hypothetical protein